MNTNKSRPLIDLSCSERESNESSNPCFADLLQARISRRQWLRGGAALVASLGLPAGLAACAGRTPAASPAASSLLGFEPIAAVSLDRITVPAGYSTQTLLPWGTPLMADAVPFRPDAGNSAAEQARQVGSHHDGMHFFPIDLKDGGSSSVEGLLVMNHEYVDPNLLHPHGPSPLPRPLAEVEKELAAHGNSIAHIRLNAQGEWQLVKDSPYNRRITGMTHMEIDGPLRGHPALVTRYSPDGTATRGTLNNCSNGVTPWGTYLTCEENWAGCFVNEGEQLREQQRYGIPHKDSYYHWHTAAPQSDQALRFNATPRAADAAGDYRNEPNTFGWIVEVDPFDPHSTPVKHTALGRFAHEGIIFQPAVAGEPLVAYSGDDTRFEYIYKYVSRDAYQPATAGAHLLQNGTLYVAVFHEDGSGEWRALDINDAAFLARAEQAGVHFADQGDVLVNTRLAADVAGATKMDRPEWGAVHPHTGEVYFTLTNNSKRTDDQVNAANPRAHNIHGHIIRWRETSGVAGSAFAWDVFWFGGEAGTAQPQFAKVSDQWSEISSPDGLRFDNDGRLWIETDMSSDGDLIGGQAFGNNGMYAADPVHGEVRRFLSGPNACELTGIAITPDQSTLFVNIQHPGEGSEPDHFISHWPDGGDSRPRSATVAIRRKDGGRVGA